MRDRQIQIMIPIVTVILAMILGGAMPTPAMKILFIICVGAGNFLYSKYKDKKDKKWVISLCVLGVVVAGMVVGSAIYAGSIDEYGIKIAGFFLPEKVPEQEEDKESAVKLAYIDINNQYTEHIEELAGMGRQFDDIIGDIGKLSTYLDEYGFLADKKNPQEIESIVAYISEQYNDNSSGFSELKKSRQGVEEFYKMRLSHQKYYYFNDISALEAFGVDCGAMGIDEYTLMLWDVHVLFSYYSMKQSILLDAAQDVIYEENKGFDYQIFKMKDMNEYSDTFNYGNWHYNTGSMDAQKINNWLDDRIMSFYEKFCMNFRSGEN